MWQRKSKCFESNRPMFYTPTVTKKILHTFILGLEKTKHSKDDVSNDNQTNLKEISTNLRRGNHLNHKKGRTIEIYQTADIQNHFRQNVT